MPYCIAVPVRHSAADSRIAVHVLADMNALRNLLRDMHRAFNTIPLKWTFVKPVPAAYPVGHPSLSFLQGVGEVKLCLNYRDPILNLSTISTKLINYILEKDRVCEVDGFGNISPLMLALKT